MTGPRGPHPELDAAALEAASQEYLRVFGTHREALVAAIRVFLAAAALTEDVVAAPREKDGRTLRLEHVVSRATSLIYAAPEMRETHEVRLAEALGELQAFDRGEV